MGQRRLFEFPIPVITQLERLAVNLDASFSAYIVFSEFIITIQRKVLKRRMKQDMRECDQKMEEIISALDTQSGLKNGLLT